MRIRFAALADYANVAEGQKLNIMGMFSRIYAATVPATHPEMQLVIQLEFQPFEIGDHRLRVALQDVDGNELLHLDGNLNIAPTPNPDPITVNHILRLRNVTFQHYGSYEFRIELNNDLTELVSVDLVPARESDQDPKSFEA